MAQDYTPPPPIDTIPPVEPMPAPKKNKKMSRSHILNIVIVLLIAGLVIFFSLKDDFNALEQQQLLEMQHYNRERWGMVLPEMPKPSKVRSWFKF